MFWRFACWQHRKSKKYYSDLDAVRIPPQTFENRPNGIDREKDYPNAKRNKFAFNYRVRDAVKKEGQPQFKASKEEISKYAKGSKFEQKYGGESNPSGKNLCDVWQIGSEPHNFQKEYGEEIKSDHFAIFPQDLITIPILFGSPKGGLVLDPFMGSGTVAVVAKKLGRNYLGIELNKFYIAIANKRLAQGVLL